ncbi:MAG: hypothetical protein ACYDA1_00050 [Vulcanimicrobiaceae bacterium]
MATWDAANPETWITCSYQGWQWFGSGITPVEYLDAAKALLETELQSRKHLERQLRGDEPIDGLSIEYALIALGKIVKTRNPDHYHGWATTIDHTLGQAERRLVFGWLQDFVRNRHRISVWIRAYRHATQRRDYARRRNAALVTDDK